MKTKKAIVVDLDGTLSLTDTFHESLLLLARNKPLLLFMIPFWMSKGRAILKAKVAEKTDLNVTLLPYNKPLIDWLKDKKNFNVKKIIDPNIPNLVKRDFTLKVSIGHGCLTYPLNLNANSIFSKKYDFHISNSNTEFFEISNFLDKNKLEDFFN